MALLEGNRLLIMIVVVHVSIVASDEVALLLFEIIPGLRRIVEYLVGSQASQKKDR